MFKQYRETDARELDGLETFDILLVN